MNFNNKNILVTGASSGIGRQIAIDLSNLGANVFLLGRDEKKLEETYSMCADDVNINIITLDLTEKYAIENIHNSIDDKFDGIVLNAGKGLIKPLAYNNIQEIKNLFDVNIFSNMILTQVLLRKKLINNGGSIVLISSIATVKPTIGMSIYNASKSALNGFAQSLAIEVATKRIRVNTILPGIVETNLLGRKRTNEEKQIRLLEYPLGRFGTPSDVSSLTCFLLSDKSSWITGAQIPIDGGFSMK